MTKYILACVCVVAFAIGCGELGAPPPPTLPEGTNGWYLQTEVFDTVTNLQGPENNVTISGVLVNSQGNNGDGSPFEVTTNFAGEAAIPRLAPAIWSIEWVNDAGEDATDANLCDGEAIDLQVYPATTSYVICYIHQGILDTAPPFFQFAPNPLYESTPPSVGQIWGSGMSTASGMPLVQYYSSADGTLVAQENASYVSSDGTYMQIPSFDISQLSGGTYFGFIDNAVPGGYAFIGSADTEMAVTTDFCRYRNPYSNDYYYTTSCYAPGFVFEGVQSTIFTAQISDTVPFYELYNYGLGMHFYTASWQEMYNCVTYYGWTYEGVVGYIGLDQIGGTTPLYRMSKSNGSHLFTTNWSEVQNAVWYYGFVYEGVAGYVPWE